MLIIVGKNVHATIPIGQPKDILGDPRAISRVGRKVDCKTVGFFLKISKEIGKAWRKSLTRAKRASLTRP